MGKERRISDAVLWGLFLVLGGIFILLNNLAFFGEWGSLAWPIIFVIAGLGFLGWYVGNRQQWGALIPGFTLLGLAATIYLGNRENVPDALLGTIFLASIGLGFWLIFLFHRDQWWAIIPGGNLWVLGALAYLNDITTLATKGLGALFFIGMGLVFAILYLVRSPRRPVWWASVPAAALLLFGIIIFIGETGIQATYWPLLLIFLGLGLLAGQYWATRPRPLPQPVEEPAPPRPVPVADMDMPVIIPLQERVPEPPPATGRIELQLPPEPAAKPTTGAAADAAVDNAPTPKVEEPAWWQTDQATEESRAAGAATDEEAPDSEESRGDDARGRSGDGRGGGEF